MLKCCSKLIRSKARLNSVSSAKSLDRAIALGTPNTLSQRLFCLQCSWSSRCSARCSRMNIYEAFFGRQVQQLKKASLSAEAARWKQSTGSGATCCLCKDKSAGRWLTKCSHSSCSKWFHPLCAAADVSKHGTNIFGLLLRIMLLLAQVLKTLFQLMRNYAGGLRQER
jgi:hypothetical protein